MTLKQENAQRHERGEHDRKGEKIQDTRKNRIHFGNSKHVRNQEMNINIEDR